MHITRIKLLNWMAFRGETLLDLGPKAYAVSARLGSDPERSNYLGKSALVEAVLFALTGWTNPSRRLDNADGWISRGEVEGHVQLTFDDGSVVDRSRKRGKSTQIGWRVSPVFGDEVMRQDQAQLAVDAAVGLSERDLLATSFCVQREAAFLVRSAGADLDEVFGSWLRLEKLQRAQERLEAAAGEAQGRVERLAVKASPSVVEPVTLAQVHALEAARDVARAKEGGLAQRLDLAQRVAMQRVIVGEYEGIVAEGKRLRAQYDQLGHEGLKTRSGDATTALGEKRAATRAALGEVNRLNALVQGNFNGTCPVNRGACPITAEIVADCARNTRELRTAQERHAKAAQAEAACFSHLGAAQRQLSEAQGVADRLQSLRDNLERLHSRYEEARALPEPEDNTKLVEALDAARRELSEAGNKLYAAVQVYNAQQKVLEVADGLVAEAEGARRRAGVLGAAALVLRRARRVITEGALGEIQDAANDDLVQLGSDLSLRLRWEREGRGLARHCEACGAAFPDSQRVKGCECGVARGPLMVARLDCQLSSRSGGAEALAGVVLQLAASRWLRAERASAWGVAVLDEVLEFMDAAHRRAVTTALPRMLAQAGMEQSFVISHDPWSAGALPGSIVVTGDGQWSRAEVVA